MNFPIAVCGLGRCGTSLVMQMLDAGGIPCHGEFPAYEPEDVGMGRDRRALLELPKAFKLIDLHRDPLFPRAVNLKAIWLDRDFEEQAKSQVKMVEMFGGITVPRRAKTIRAFKARLRVDREDCLDRLAESGADVFHATFEGILSNPWTFAHDLQSFVRQSFDEAKAANAVLARRLGCAPDMGIELALCDDPSVLQRKMDLLPRSFGTDLKKLTRSTRPARS